MIVALARPVIEKGDKVVDVKGLSLLVGLDISGSMRSTDLYPNRLEFAKKKMFEFFESEEIDRAHPFDLGANAVIGVDIDYEVLGEKNGMLMVSVSGTAVKVE